MAPHCGILPRRIPRTEEPGGGYSPPGRKESDMTESTHTRVHTCKYGLLFPEVLLLFPSSLKWLWFAKHFQALYTTEASTVSLERLTLHDPQAGGPGFDPWSGN